MSFPNDTENYLQRQADFSVLVDAKGRIVASSAQISKSALPKNSGCHELLGLHHSCPCDACYIRLALETNQPVTDKLNHPELGAIQVRVHPLSEQNGRRELATLHIVPVPQNSPDGLASKAEKQALDSLPQAIFDTDLEGRITFANQHYLELFGLTASALAKDIDLEHMLTPAEGNALRQLFKRVLQNKRCLSGEFNAVTQNGDSLSAMIHLSALTENGRSVGVRGLLLDIARQKALDAALVESETRCLHLTHHDQLTGLPNRTLLAEWIWNTLKRASQQGKPLTVMLLNLDRFKQVVDSLGDNCGDQVLCEITRRLSKQLRRNDILARLSGDEFALVYGNVSHPENLGLLARRLLDTLQIPMQIAAHSVYQTASIGIVTSRGGETPATLLRQAAMAMNDAKLQGGNHYAYFCQEMQSQREENFLFEKHMREALQREAFYLHYQPQVDLTNGRMTGVEALVRWAGPKGDNPSPETFIKVAEESGLIHPLGEYILHEACAQNLRWQQSGLAPIQVTVNISAKQFGQPDFVGKVLQTLTSTGLAPQWLELEITESAIMANIKEAIGIMHHLQQAGVRFAIDDFGTGHSSLNYLRQLPLSKLKIDRSFLLEIPGNRDNEKLVFSILALARSFDLQTVAEGIETQEQLDYLQQLDCDIGQGYLFSRPVAAEAIPALLSNDHC
ncbi:MAG: hypothetical protein BA871_08025 [Desulfuromonadales bacterium C00003096]|jgi:diguanylate cyclase (GGDEF)-like protein/PAS domain S-box-containing protein|nr:MAG: hypothetical protein BA871_08025 [Desulfuromonadales bacterium C00003096]